MKSYNTGSTVCRKLRYFTLLTDDERFYHVLKKFLPLFHIFNVLCVFEIFFSNVFASVDRSCGWRWRRATRSVRRRWNRSVRKKRRRQRADDDVGSCFHVVAIALRRPDSQLDAGKFRRRTVRGGFKEWPHVQWPMRPLSYGPQRPLVKINKNLHYSCQNGICTPSNSVR